MIESDAQHYQTLRRRKKKKKNNRKFKLPPNSTQLYPDAGKQFLFREMSDTDRCLTVRYLLYVAQDQASPLNAITSKTL